MLHQTRYNLSLAGNVEGTQESRNETEEFDNFKNKVTAFYKFSVTGRKGRKMVKQKEPDLFEIRENQAENALKLIRSKMGDGYLGQKNDSTYYIVLKNKEKAKQAETLLQAEGIATQWEERPFAEQVALHFKDKEDMNE